MTRFAVVATVVSAAVALLVFGALSGDLALVYISIGLAALALVMLVVGVAVWRDQVFAAHSPAGGPVAADQRYRAQPGKAPGGPAQAGPPQPGPGKAGRAAPADDRRARPAAASSRAARTPRQTAAPSATAPPGHDHPADRGGPEREQPGRQPVFGGPRPATAAWQGHQRDTASADRAGGDPSGAGRPAHPTAFAEGPGREVSPPAGRPSGRPEGAEPYPQAEQPGPADDPTRLAHRLGIGRQASATAGPASRTRKPDARAAETKPAPPPSGPATTGQPGAPAEPGPPGRPTAGDTAPADRKADAAAQAVEALEAAKAAARAGAAAGGRAPASTGASTGAAEGGAEPTPASAAASSPEAAATAGAVSQADEGGAPAADPDTEVLVVPGIARYHKADCILIRFLGEDDLQKMSRQEAEDSGAAACRACRP